MVSMRVAGTGHRTEQCEDEFIVRRKIKDALVSVDVDSVYCGMADGYDLWLADEALAAGIPVIACRPWANHYSSDKLYDYVIEHATDIINVSESEEYPGPWAYHNRNHYMVDSATHVLAYLDPNTKSGGTYQCVKYAKSKGKPVRNIYG